MNPQIETSSEQSSEMAMTGFINAMSRAVSGVSIVTTDGPFGRFGLTVSSMVSVSAEPPMLLICINRASTAHDAIRDNGIFTINVLTSRQQGVANRFAGRGRGRRGLRHRLGRRLRRLRFGFGRLFLSQRDCRQHCRHYENKSHCVSPQSPSRFSMSATQISTSASVPTEVR